MSLARVEISFVQLWRMQTCLYLYAFIYILWRTSIHKFITSVSWSPGPARFYSGWTFQGPLGRCINTISIRLHDGSIWENRRQKPWTQSFAYKRAWTCMLETENSIYKILNVSESCHHNYYVIQDARFLFVRHRQGGGHKPRTPPTPGFVIVNTDDDGDDEKQGARYDMKRKKDEIMKMLQRIYI